MSTEASRAYNWVTDLNNSVAITASRMDTEFDAIITKLNQKALIKSSAPSGPIEGMLWYDSTNKVFKVYRNSTWIQIVDAVNAQTIAGVKTFSDQPVLSAGVKSDTISEKTAATGVTIDGCLIKDGSAAQAFGATGVDDSTIEISANKIQSKLLLGVYDSGWFAVAANTTYTKTHGLGTTKVLSNVYIAQNSDGSGWMVSQGMTNDSELGRQACMVTMSTTQIQLRTDTTLINFTNAAGTASVNPSSGYARIIMLSLAA